MENITMITNVFMDHPIRQRRIDGFISVNDMSKVIGKSAVNCITDNDVANFARLLHKNSQFYHVKFIDIEMGVKEVGIWVHPNVAHYIASSYSNMFAEHIVKWTDDWSKLPVIAPQMNIADTYRAADFDMCKYILYLIVFLLIFIIWRNIKQFIVSLV